MKTKKRILICALLLCGTFFICTNSYATTQKKVGTKFDPIEILVFTKTTPLKS